MRQPRYSPILPAMLVALGLVSGCGGNNPPASGTEKHEKVTPVPHPEVPAPPPRQAVEINPALKEAALKELRGALSSSEPRLRAHAVEGLREALGSGARPELLRALEDKAGVVRFAAAMAIGDLRIEEARPRLLPLVDDSDPHVQIGAVYALHRIGDYRFSSRLEEALKNPDWHVRGSAVVALGRTGNTSAIRVLRRALQDPEPEVRLQAAEGLWRLGDENALKILVPVSLGTNPADQEIALMALAGKRDRIVIEHVRAGLDYPEIKLVAARALAMLGSDEGYVPAIEATRSAEPRERYKAAFALGAIGRADANDELAPLLKDPDPEVRLAAATAILELR